jgi:hypothetical protein
MHTTTDKSKRSRKSSTSSSKKPSTKGSGNGNGHAEVEESDGFTSGPENTNIRRMDEHPAAGKRRKKEEQKDLPGMEDRRIDPLHEKALEYKALREEWQTALKKFTEAKTQLIDLMHAHKKELYQCQGVKVTITHAKENVKVELDIDADEDPEAEE